MKIRNKILTILMVFALSCFCLTGCNISYLLDDGVVYKNTITYNITGDNAVVYDSLVEMLEDVRPTVYEVYAKNTGDSMIGCGSGTLIGKYTDSANRQCYVLLTCHHVINEKYNVLIKDIYGNYFKVDLMGGDPDSDIAIYSFCPENQGLYKSWTKTDTDKFTLDGVSVEIKTAKIRDVSKTTLKVGESCYAIGNPLGTLGGTVTSGIISATNREIKVGNRNMNLIQTDCAINSGNSGGALFDVSGNLIGVVNAGYQGSVEGLNFAIPIDTAMQIQESLAKTYTNVNFGYVEGRARISANYGELFQGNDISVGDVQISDWNTQKEVRICGLSQYYSQCGLSLYDKINSVSVKSVQTGKTEIYVVSSDTIVSGDEVLTPSKQLVEFLLSKERKIGDIVSFNVDKYSTGENTTINITLKQYIYGNTNVFTQGE